MTTPFFITATAYLSVQLVGSLMHLRTSPTTALHISLQKQQGLSHSLLLVLPPSAMYCTIKLLVSKIYYFHCSGYPWKKLYTNLFVTKILQTKKQITVVAKCCLVDVGSAVYLVGPPNKQRFGRMNIKTTCYDKVENVIDYTGHKTAFCKCVYHFLHAFFARRNVLLSSCC